MLGGLFGLVVVLRGQTQNSLWGRFEIRLVVLCGNLQCHSPSLCFISKSFEVEVCKCVKYSLDLILHNILGVLFYADYKKDSKPLQISKGE